MKVPAWLERAAPAIAIAGATVLAYWRALPGGFVWDDHVLLLESALLRGPLWRIWFSSDATDYWPLTWTSLWIDWRLWGRDAMPLHVVNVALHAVASILLWRVLRALRVPGAALAGLLFAIHPVAVESVAWISERKNVLSATLFFGSLLAWTRYDDQGPRRDAVASFLLYLLALLAKTSVVMLPFVQLGVALHRRGRVARRDLARTAPFFALSTVFAGLTIWFQGTHVVRGGLVERGWAERLGGAAWALASYAQKAFAPVELAIVYSRWPVDPRSAAYWLPAVVVAALVAGAWFLRSRPLARPVSLALGYHALMVFPVLGLLDMAYFAVGPVSNHLQYLALAAPSALVGAGLAVLHRRHARVAVGLGLSIVLALLASTHRRAAAFEDDLHLWAAAVQESPRSLYAALSYAAELGQSRSLGDAVRELESFVDRSPDEADRHLARSHRAVLLRQPAEAAREAIAAEQQRPDVQRQIEVAQLMVSTGFAAEAIPILTLQVQSAPRSAEVHYWLAAAQVRTGRADLARQAVVDGLRVAPRDPKLRQALERLDREAQRAPLPREPGR